MVNDIKFFTDRAIKWAHDSLLVLGLVSVYLFVSGFLPQDIGKEIQEKYAQTMVNKKGP